MNAPKNEAERKAAFKDWYGDLKYGSSKWPDNLWDKINVIMSDPSYDASHKSIWELDNPEAVDEIYKKIPSRSSTTDPNYIQGNNSGGVKAAVGQYKSMLEAIRDFEDDFMTKAPGNTREMSTPISNIYKECKKLLEANHNIILSGAPGTGKTYMAHKIARVITGGDKSRIEFVQFHPSYDYTDFVEGLRPTPPIGGTVGFECKDGIFKAFCEKALCALETYNSSAASSYVVPGSVASSYASGKGGSSLAAKIEHIYNIIVDGIKAGEKWTITTVNGIEKELFVNKNGNLYVKNETREIVLTLAILLRISETLKTKKDVIAAKNFRNITGIKNWDTDLRAIMILIYSIIESEEPYTDAVNSEMSSNQLDNPNISSDIIRGTAQSEEYPYFVFIIDEINRGEMSKVFGELFFSIDPGYRGAEGKVRTQYANMVSAPNAFDKVLGVTDPKDCGHFFVPENVYIIGTMNDIDRSVDTMDFAMRRRFLIKEIKAEDTQNEMLKDENVKAKMNALNDIIGDTSDKRNLKARLGSAYALGASYFMKYEKYSGTDKEKFRSLWDNHLEGILREYLRGTADPDSDLRELKKAYDPDHSIFNRES